MVAAFPVNARSVSRGTCPAGYARGCMFEALEFRYPFRRYQRMILDRIEMAPADDGRYHIVAPPGSSSMRFRRMAG